MKRKKNTFWTDGRYHIPLTGRTNTDIVQITLIHSVQKKNNHNNNQTSVVIN